MHSRVTNAKSAKRKTSGRETATAAFGEEFEALRYGLETALGKKPTKRARTTKVSKAVEVAAPKPRGRPKCSGAAKTSTTDAATEKSKGRGKGSGKGKGKGKAKEKGPTKKQLAELRKAGNITNFNNLFNSDIFRDVATNRGLDSLPGFDSTKKDEAMKELLASLPSEIQSNAKTDKDQILRATKSFGPNRCRATGSGQWKIAGMRSELTHYQMLGTAFMRERELQETEEPRGGKPPVICGLLNINQLPGILADAMGLGKTVCMIANIVNGRRSSKTTRESPTLIVAAPSILLQWADEIKTHAEDKVLGTVIRYSATGMRNLLDPFEQLMSQGIILTTYNEVGKSYPKYNPPLEYTTVEEKAAWWDEHYEKTRGFLHRIKFHRVVLDEAQAIKNPQSQCSVGCRGLKAIHRWAISGTPVQNSLTEFYPYFKFLRVPFTGNSKVFNANFCTTSDPRGTERLNLLLSKFMIRRTHNDTLLGAKLLTLPKPSKRTMRCHFRDIERQIYTVVRTRFVLRINAMSRQGQLRQNYSSIFVMLLRLRQLVGHPLLIQDTLKDLLEPEDFQKLKKITEMVVPEHSQDAAILQHLRMMLRAPKQLPTLEPVRPASLSLDLEAPVPSPEIDDHGADTAELGADAKTADAEAGATPDATPEQTSSRNSAAVTATDTYEEINADPARENTAEDAVEDTAQSSTDPSTAQPADRTVLGKAFGLKNNYGEFIHDLETESTFINEQEPAICCLCNKDPPVDLHVTSCDHTYCQECLLKLSFQAGSAGLDQAVCVVCGESYTGCKPYSYIATKTRQVSPAPQSAAAANVSHHQGSALDGDAKKLKPPSVSATRQVIDTWLDAEGHMLPSAKTLAIKAQVMNWLQEDPTAKIL